MTKTQDPAYRVYRNAADVQADPAFTAFFPEAPAPRPLLVRALLLVLKTLRVIALVVFALTLGLVIALIVGSLGSGPAHQGGYGHGFGYSERG